MQLSLTTPLNPTELRSLEILGRLRSIFAKKGFDGASMQDLARAAGMSAGNFYRYFPSKAAIIDALIGADMDRLEQDFQAALQTRNPMATLRSQLRDSIRDHQCQDGCLWAEIHAAALRKPEVGAIIDEMERKVTRFLVQVFGRETGLPLDEAHIAFAPRAGLVISLFRSAAMIGPPSSAVKEQLTDQILMMIEKTLDEISSHRRKD